MGWNIEGTLIEKDWEAEKVPAKQQQEIVQRKN